MSDIYWFVFFISVPIFYIWGVVSFIQRVTGNKKSAQSSDTSESKTKFIQYFFERIAENPDLSLREFLDEVQGQNELSSPQTIEDPDHDDVFADDASVPNLSDLLNEPQYSSQAEAKPAFSLSEWYRDHSIDFVLYLGAFMIVAAVSLFVGFQWENLGGYTRFGIVVGFTVMWFVAAIAVERLLSLDSVTIAFLTIGSIILPFCGVAWQRFVVDSLANLGITWLVTSIIGTTIYLILSLVYQRRHFTYFGNLSVLASVLAIVEISGSPDEYFILAGAVSGVLLLIARSAVQMLAPHLDEYLGRDVEYSSLGIIGSSVVGGLLLLSSVDLTFLSIEVLAVMIVTLIYSILYLRLHFNGVTVAIVQALAIGTLTHGLLTFAIDDRIVLYSVLVVSIILQYFTNRVLQDRDGSAFLVSNSLSLLISLIVYLVSLTVTDAGFLSIPILLALMAHATFYAIKLENPYTWYLVAILAISLLAHILWWLEIDREFWMIWFIGLGIIQLVSFTWLSLPNEITQPFTYVAITLIGFAGFVSIIGDVFDYYINDFAEILARINPFIVLASYSIVLWRESEHDERILNSYIALGVASVSLLYYLVSVASPVLLLPVFYALTVCVLFWLAQRLTSWDNLYYIVFAMPYFALAHLLFAVDVQLEVYPIAFAIMSIALFFANPLPDETQTPRQWVALAAVLVISVFALLTYAPMSIMLAGWVSSYTFLALLYLSRWRFGEVQGNVIFAIATLLQYYWHIVFLQEYVNYEIFSNTQWFSASFATLVIGASIVALPNEDDENSAFVLQGVGACILMLPTLGQILETQSLLYFGLGVAYSLILGGFGITFKQPRMRTIASIALVLVVLSQSSEFLINLPRWLVVGVVGFGLVGAALYLSLRRRNVKKDSQN